MQEFNSDYLNKKQFLKNTPLMFNMLLVNKYRLPQCVASVYSCRTDLMCFFIGLADTNFTAEGGDRVPFQISVSLH